MKREKRKEEEQVRQKKRKEAWILTKLEGVPIASEEWWKSREYAIRTADMIFG
jgi:hypothetical protein